MMTAAKDERHCEYLLEFDSTIGLQPMWLEYDAITRLATLRAELQSTLRIYSQQEQPGPSQTALSSRLATPCRLRSRTDARPSRRRSLVWNPPHSSASASASGHRKPRDTLPTCNHRTHRDPPAARVKQLDNLLDPEAIGRSPSLEAYALCHHCKFLKPIASELVKCKYCSQKDGKAVPSTLTVNGVTLYNGTCLARVPSGRN
jgi:hypothetical protein